MERRTGAMVRLAVITSLLGIGACSESPTTVDSPLTVPPPSYSLGVSWAHNSRMAFWHGDGQVFSVSWHVFGVYEGPGEKCYYRLTDGPPESKISLSFSPDEVIHELRFADGVSGNVTVWGREVGLGASDFGPMGTAWVRTWCDHSAGGTGVYLKTSGIGQLTPEEAGPFRGSVTGFTETYRFESASSTRWRWSYGIYDVGMQVTGGNWVAPGGRYEPYAFNSSGAPAPLSIWTTTADVILAEPAVSHWPYHAAAAIAAAESGKVVVVSQTVFDLFVASAGGQPESVSFGGFDFSILHLGSGGVIAAGQSFDYPAAPANYLQWAVWQPYDYPTKYLPWDGVPDFARALNQAIASVAQQAPVADAGPDQEVECTQAILGCTKVQLDGRASRDADGEIVEFVWRDSNGVTLATGATPVVSLTPGRHLITLTVTDDDGLTSTDEVEVTVVDRVAPRISAAETLTELGAPNHKMVTVVRGLAAADDCDPDVQLTVAVTSDEPVDGKGDGHTSSDWLVTENPDGSFDVQVRSERSGAGTGRTYEVRATALDSSGNTAMWSVRIQVDHDQGRGGLQ